MNWLLFTGLDHYPEGGADDCVGYFQGTEPSAIEWAEKFEADVGNWWQYPEWKHLAAIQDSGLIVAKRWERNSDLIPIEGGHRKQMKNWEEAID